MGPRSRRGHARYVQPLTPLMEGPDPEVHCESSKKERYWEAFRSWMRTQMDRGMSGRHFSVPFHGNKRRTDLRVMLGVLGCPLAPIPLSSSEPSDFISVKDTPIETSSARYIIQQYLAASGCLKLDKCLKNMYAVGSVKMVCSETDGRAERIRTRGGENGCFVLWQMSPDIWLVELVAAGYKLVAGSNGKIVWRNLPWLGINAAEGPQRPLRRIIQGLDPKCTANMFNNARCLGEKRIGNDSCFVLKVSADRATIVERSTGPAEVIRHVLYGYFSQRNGLLIYLEDSHLARVQPPGSDAIYWETTIGSTIEEYKEVDGMLIAHRGRTVATVFGFRDASGHRSRTTLEEDWRIEDVVFNVPGLSFDCFIPPTEAAKQAPSS